MNINVVVLSTLIIISCSQLHPKPGNYYDGVIYDYPKLGNYYDGVIYDYDVKKTNPLGHGEYGSYGVHEHGYYGDYEDENINDEPFIPAGFQKGQPNQRDSFGRCIEWNEETQQVQLCTVDCGYAYQHNNFGGQRFPLSNQTNMPHGFNDYVSSMKVKDDYLLRAWEHSVYNGNHKDFSGEVSSLGDWNDKISSMKCIKRNLGLKCNTLTKEECKEDEMCSWERYICIKAKLRYCRHPDKNINSLHRDGESFYHCCHKCFCECFFGECRTTCHKSGCPCGSCKKGECDAYFFARCSWNDMFSCINGNKEGKPRIVKLKIFLDDLMVAKYKEKFGEKYKEEATNIIKKLTNSASKYLKKLDAGGYITKMDEPLLLLSDSPYKIGNTYFDRLTNTLKHDLDKSDTISYAFAFQDAVDDAENHQQSTDTILFIITPRRRNTTPTAATEEFCLCKNPPPFPCIGIFSVDLEPNYWSSGMLLAHEIGHALGAKEHDSISGTIMYSTASGGVWSQFSKDQINKQDNSCLKETESSEQYFESSIMETEETESSEQYFESVIMETDAKNPPQDDRLSHYRRS